MEDETPNPLEALLRENLEVSRENNRILRDMRRLGRIAFWSKVVIWAIVLLLPLLLIGPILDFLSEGTGASVMGLPSASVLEEAFLLYTGQE